MNHFKILKEFQGCLSIQLSKICIAQTQYLSGVLSLICYRLPRRLVYNIIRYTHCQQLFSKMLLSHFAVGVHHITPIPACQLFFRVKKTAEPAGKGAEKEGVEPSRRLPDLHP